MASGTLYIIATPIGNLEDITFRAVRILREVDLIAAEDTRHSRKLLTHFGISRPLTSYFDHNQQVKGGLILEKLREGLSVALISDAGTPCISDPGYQLVRDAAAEGITVVPLPGPSAAVAALSASGLPTDSFTFEGFLPSKRGKRLEKLKAVAGERRVLIFYESPNRLVATLEDMLEALGNRRAVVARELTKIHEEFARGSICDILASYRERPVKGEVVILVDQPQEEVTPVVVESIDGLLRGLLGQGLSLKDAVKQAAAESGKARSEVYQLALRLKGPDGGEEE